MLTSTLLLLCFIIGAGAFRVPARYTLRSLRMAVPLEILGRDIQVGGDIKSKIESKIGKAIEKLASDATSCQVTMKVVKNPEGESHQSMKQDSHIGEVSVFLKGGVTIKVTESAGDLDTVVDLLSHTLTESLKRHKDKFVDKIRHSPGIGALTAEPDDSA